jgi:hypothetical protein
VTVRFSYAKDEARTGHNSGDTTYGRHAKENIGVSIVRAGRELELDQGFVIQYETTERWWGVEVDFPPALDDLFGVSNNKQSARHFAELARLDIDAMLKDATIHEVMAGMAADDDPRGPLLEVANKIKNGLSGMRGLIRLQGKGSRTTADPEGTMAEPAPCRKNRDRPYHRTQTGRAYRTQR